MTVSWRMALQGQVLGSVADCNGFESHAEMLPTAASLNKTTNLNVWIVVPAYNEGDRLRRTIHGLAHRFPNIVVVDDGSRDRTFDTIESLPVWGLRHPINLGQGAALQTGIDFALRHGADIIVTFDADGQHDVRDIDTLMEPILLDRADITLGSRFLGQEAINMPASRWLILKLGVLFTRLCSRINVTDTHNGFRAISKFAAQKLRITQNRMAHASEILDQIQYLGLRYEEVPVTIHYNDAVLEKGQQNSAALKIAAQFLLGRMVR